MRYTRAVLAWTLIFCKSEAYEPQLLATLHADAQVNTLVWAPAGALLATGEDEKTIQLWNVGTATATALLQSRAHYYSVQAVAYSPDGRLLASGNDDNTVTIWNVSTRKALTILEGHRDWTLSVAWNPSGKVLASSSSDGSVKLWDTALEMYSHICCPSWLRVDTGLYWKWPTCFRWIRRAGEYLGCCERQPIRGTSPNTT